MAVDGINEWTMTPSRKAGGSPRENTRFSLCVEDEQADAGRDGQTCLARSNSQARTATGKTCSADHEQDWKPYPVDPYSAESGGHTYIVYMHILNRMTGPVTDYQYAIQYNHKHTSAVP